MLDRIKRCAVQIIGEEELESLLRKKHAIVKLGADPTRPDIHLGHTVILRIMRELQNAGHEIVFIIGDYTAMVGDPSGKSKTRPSLSLEETRASGQSYFEQVTKILDPTRTRIIYNSEWLEELRFKDLLALASRYTLAQMLERDDFQNRFSSGQPIAIHELLYPLMQGYDSVAIHADIELGGTDQTFNLLVGRALQKAYGQPSQVVITFPLLVGLDGKQKMSKSLDNYIGIDEPPEIMYEKAMKIPDPVLEDYFRLTTDIPQKDYSGWMQQDIVDAHRRYAAEIIRLYHGEAALPQAQARYMQIAQNHAPEQMPCILITEAQLPLADLLCAHGLTASKSAARRLIQQGAVSLNGAREQDAARRLTTQDFVSGEMMVKLGKNRYYKFVLKKA